MVRCEALEDRAMLSALDDYVAAPDASYAYSLNKTINGGSYIDYVIDLTSQTWRTSAEVDKPVWKHWLEIIVPSTVSSTTAVLQVVGGSNTATPPSSANSGGVISALALSAITVVLPTVPNEPLKFAGESFSRSEDSIIAYSFDKLLDGGDSNWPLLLPMVKSAVRAMDTAQAFIVTQTGGARHIDNFVVSGASKRGWTTWLTPAVDARVSAIVPFVFDALNMAEWMPHQKDLYFGVSQFTVGGYSSALQDYVNFDVPGRINTPQGQLLGQIVDPYAYLNRSTYNIPKYVVLSTGDQFFAPDAEQYYWDDLPGPKYLRYVPNTDHSLNSSASTGAVSFTKALLSGYQLPRFSWNVADGGTTINLNSIDAPTSVKLWQATSTNRDFRLQTLGSAWTSSTLSDLGGGNYSGHVTAPATGARAFFIEMTYNVNGLTLTFTTQVSEIPLLTPSLQVAAPGGIYNGNPFAATATAARRSGDPLAGAFTYAYYLGATPTGASTSTPPVGPGTYTVVASFAAADSAYAPAQSAPVTFSIAPLPRVTGVFVRGTSWDPSVAPYAIPVGSGEQLKPLSWSTVDEISITFNTDVIVAQNNLTITGNQGPYAFSGFSYSPATRTAMWTLAQPLGIEHVELHLASGLSGAGVQSTGGVPLDGEWVNPTSPAQLSGGLFPSGNLTPGGDFVFDFWTHPGDATGDDRVTGADYTIWAASFGTAFVPGVLPPGDFTGDGLATGADYTIWAANFQSAAAALPVARSAALPSVTLTSAALPKPAAALPRAALVDAAIAATVTQFRPDTVDDLFQTNATKRSALARQ